MINQSEPMDATKPNYITRDTIMKAIEFLKASESDQDRLMRHLYDIFVYAYIHRKVFTNVGKVRKLSAL